MRHSFLKLFSDVPELEVIRIIMDVYCVALKVLSNIISNSWGKHKANQYHDGDFIPDKTYWRQKEY